MIALKPVRPPISLEREYHKKLKRLIKAMNESLYAGIRSVYKEIAPQVVADGALGDTQSRIRQLTAEWQKQFDQEAEKLADWFAGKEQGYVVRNLQAQMRKSNLARVGFDLNFSYHSQREKDIFKAIVAENVNLIKSIASEHLTKVEGVVMRGIQTGHDLSTMSENLEESFGVTERRAAMIARDQTNKATSNLTRARLLDYGVKKGQWMHTSAGKTYRDSHVDMDGEIYDIEQGCFDPDYGDYIQPAELVNCHCVCIPVIDAGEDEEQPEEEQEEEKEEQQEEPEEELFTPAATIKEANAFAEKLFDVTADYKGLDLRVANQVNESAWYTFKEFPEVTERVEYLGESHNRVQLAKARYSQEVEEKLEKWGVQRGTKSWNDLYNHSMRSFASSNRISSNVYATSYSNFTGKVWEGTNGICVNKANAKEALKMEQSLKRDVSSGFHPLGCDTIKSVIDHELAHQVDRMMDFANSKEFKDAFKGVSRAEIEKGVSRYATTNRHEFIAEAWAEYCNNPNPRPLAKKMGELLKEYYKKWKKGQK